MRGGEGGGAGVGAAGILEGRQATSFAAYRFIPAGFETATWRIGSRKKTSGSTASNFQAMLRPLTCFLTMRTMVTIRSRKVTMLMAQPYMPAAWAAEFTSSQSVPAQMSEPWHVLKPGRQAGRRGRVQAARIDGCSRAGVIYGVQSDQRNQRTAIVVADAVGGGGPGAKRLGLIDASGLPDERENDGEDDFEGNVEAGADHRAHVESAAAAAAFDVRSHAHGDACACDGRTGSPMCCGR